jgi:hypothetical protein
MSYTFIGLDSFMRTSTIKFKIMQFSTPQNVTQKSIHSDVGLTVGASLPCEAKRESLLAKQGTVRRF